MYWSLSELGLPCIVFMWTLCVAGFYAADPHLWQQGRHPWKHRQETAQIKVWWFLSDQHIYYSPSGNHWRDELVKHRERDSLAAYILTRIVTVTCSGSISYPHKSPIYFKNLVNINFCYPDLWWLGNSRNSGLYLRVFSSKLNFVLMKLKQISSLSLVPLILIWSSWTCNNNSWSEKI